MWSYRPEFELVFVSWSIFATCESLSTVSASHHHCCLAPIDCPRSARLASLHRMLRSVIGRGAALKWEHILDIKRSRAEDRASLARRFIVYTFLAPETTVTFRVGWTTCRDSLDFRLICKEILKHSLIAAWSSVDFERILKVITFEQCRCCYLLLRLGRG